MLLREIVLDRRKYLWYYLPMLLSILVLGVLWVGALIVAHCL